MGWAAPDPAQERLRRDFVAHLLGHDDGVWRTCRPAHVTASALVVDGDRVLLTLHPKAGLWVQTGGHCEAGDLTLAHAALREASEESGIEGLRIRAEPVRLDRHPAPCRPGVEHHLDVQYVAVASPGAVPRRSAESRDLAWFARSSLPNPTDRAVRTLAAAATRTTPVQWTSGEVQSAPLR